MMYPQLEVVRPAKVVGGLALVSLASEAMGGPRRSPAEAVTSLSEAIDLIRATWDAGRRGGIFADGEQYRIRGAKRGPEPAHDVPIWLGVLGPRMLRLAGVFPSPVECPSCGNPFSASGAILPRSGENLLCHDCGGRGGLAISGATLAFLRRISREALPAVAGQPPPEAVLRQVEDLCCQVRRYFLQRELRSYEVIHKTRMGM